MLTVHHLNQSRSQRVLWALEELQLPYQIVRYQREKTMLAPAALKKIHPLGKSPVLEDNGYVLAESGAILEYLQETWDSGGLLKPQGIDDKLQYRFWLHYAEGIADAAAVNEAGVRQPWQTPCALWRSLAGFAAGKGDTENVARSAAGHPCAVH